MPGARERERASLEVVNPREVLAPFGCVALLEQGYSTHHCWPAEGEEGRRQNR